MTDLGQPQPQRVKRVKRNHKQLIDLMELAITLGYLWIMVHPEQAENLKDRVTMYRQTIQHKISVWKAIISIRTLPEERNGR